MRGEREDVPRELHLYWQYVRFNTLPRGGGTEDQEAGLLERMSIIGDAYMAYSEYWKLTPGTGAAWQRRNPGKWAIVAEIEGLNG